MNGFTVLMYHEIILARQFKQLKNLGIKVRSGYSDKLPELLFCYQAEFKKQMQYLFENGYNVIGIEDLIDFYYRGKDLPEKAVLLTFDDLYKSIYQTAFPILKKYNFSAVGFVVKDWIFNEKQPESENYSVCLSKEEVEEMGVVFNYANHSTSLHKRIDGKSAFQMATKELLIKDLNKCAKIVDYGDVFAYPFGLYIKDNVKWLKELDFKLAFTSKPGKNTSKNNPLELNRNAVPFNFDLDKFKELLV